jgi:hypothetical protein
VLPAGPQGAWIGDPLPDHLAEYRQVAEGAHRRLPLDVLNLLMAEILGAMQKALRKIRSTVYPQVQDRG